MALNDTGLVHAANAAPSTLHSDVPSLTLNVNVTYGPLVESIAGPPVIVTVGETVSTVQLAVAGDASVWPAASVARTANVWAPCASIITVCGDVQAVNAPPSS